MMYATARFCARISACGFDPDQEMSAARVETLEYFVEQYRKMLEENLDDCIEHFNKYKKPADEPKA